jgi:hypothetical protein
MRSIRLSAAVARHLRSGRESSWAPAVLLAILALAFCPAPAFGAGGDVATVAGAVITRHEFDHWIRIAAHTSAAQSSPVIVPTDPPRFNACIAEARRKIPSLQKTPIRILRATCRQLFGSLEPAVLDFLIKDRWYEDRAAADGITITARRVRQVFEADKRDQFSTSAQLRRFLKETGQTTADILFRVRASLLYAALLKGEHVSQRALSAEIEREYRPQTTCARYYVIADCARA